MKAFMQHPFSIDHIDVIVYVGLGQGRPVHRDRPHHGIVIQKEGTVFYTFEDQKTFRLQKNEMIYLPRGANYRVHTAPEAKGIGGCYAINFTTSDGFADEPFLFKPSSPSVYLEHFRAAERAWKMRRPGDVMRCMAELYSILSAMQTEYAAYLPKNKAALIQPALDYIAEYYCRPNISIPALADLCSVSEPYFRRLFQACTGTSPLKYIAARKIERACELLHFGGYSVRTTAEMCGYADECYFSREFRKAMGLSPAAYQKQMRETGLDIRPVL